MLNVMDVAKVAGGVWAIRRASKRRGKKIVRVGLGVAGAALAYSGAMRIAASSPALAGGAGGVLGGDGYGAAT